MQARPTDLSPSRGPLLTAQQAAQRLAVPHTWLLAQARENKCPHIRLGRYVRFDADDLAEWVREQARGPRARQAA
jgi:excisionase family DNA binding protein